MFFFYTGCPVLSSCILTHVFGTRYQQFLQKKISIIAPGRAIIACILAIINVRFVSAIRRSYLCHLSLQTMHTHIPMAHFFCPSPHNVLGAHGRYVTAIPCPLASYSHSLPRTHCAVFAHFLLPVFCITRSFSISTASHLRSQKNNEKLRSFLVIYMLLFLRSVPYFARSLKRAIIIIFSPSQTHLYRREWRTFAIHNSLWHS